MKYGGWPASAAVARTLCKGLGVALYVMVFRHISFLTPPFFFIDNQVHGSITTTTGSGTNVACWH